MKEKRSEKNPVLRSMVLVRTIQNPKNEKEWSQPNKDESGRGKLNSHECYKEEGMEKSLAALSRLFPQKQRIDRKSRGVPLQ